MWSRKVHRGVNKIMESRFGEKEGNGEHNPE